MRNKQTVREREGEGGGRRGRERGRERERERKREGEREGRGRGEGERGGEREGRRGCEREGGERPKYKSTTDAIELLLSSAESTQSKYVVAIFYDIAGAFDNLWWPALLNQLRTFDCPRNLFRLLSSFLTGRTVHVNLPNSKVVRTVKRGCAQGSVLGLPLWNIILDQLLWEIRKAGFLPSAFVDDLGVAIEGTSRVDIEKKATKVTNIIIKWCKENKLSLNNQKTKFIFLKGKMSESWPPRFQVGDVLIEPSDQVKFLGVTIGERCRFISHLKEIHSKVALRFCCLNRIARNSWGLSYKNRDTLYKAAYLPVVLYAARIWGQNLTVNEKRVLLMSQRRALLLVTGAYKTAPTSALQVLAGHLPIDLQLDLSVARLNIKRGLPGKVGNRVFYFNVDSGEEAERRIYEAALDQWQERWDTATDGRMTFQFFPNIKDRLNMKWIRPDYWTSQLMTGHGDFNSKLHFFGKKENPNCFECGAEEDSTHVLLDCPLYTPQRMKLAGEFGLLNWPPSHLKYLVDDEDKFNIFNRFARDVLKHKASPN